MALIRNQGINFTEPLSGPAIAAAQKGKGIGGAFAQDQRGSALKPGLSPWMFRLTI